MYGGRTCKNIVAKLVKKEKKRWGKAWDEGKRERQKMMTCSELKLHLEYCLILGNSNSLGFNLSVYRTKESHLLISKFSFNSRSL